MMVACFSACNTLTSHRDFCTSIEFTILPSPPKQKTITGEHDIKTILEFIESIDKEETSNNNINGWTVKIVLNGKENHTLFFIGNMMRYDSQLYRIDETVVKQLKTLYDTLNYYETVI